MSKCGKGTTDCVYYATHGCMSPFNCKYKENETTINSATSTFDTGIQKYFQGLVVDGVISQEPINYDAATLKIYIAHLEAENAELRARLEKAVELPCKLGDTTVYAIECYSCGYYMREYCAAEIAVTEDGEFAFYSPEIPARRLIFGKDIFTSKEAAEARLKKIKENNDDVRRI